MPGREVFGEEERAQIAEVMEQGVLFRYGFDAQRAGVFKVAEFEKKFASYLGCSYALGVSSGSAALKVALESSDLPKGSAILTSSFTFVASIEAIEESGYVPVLCEADASYNISVEDMERQYSPQVSAVLPVHMMGSSCDMEGILQFAQLKNLVVIEDACQATGATYKGKYLGSLGAFGCFSFDYAKILTTGEGGMVVTSDQSLYLKSDRYHDHGHSHRTDLARGFEPREGKGFNYRMSELQGALGIAQLAKLPSIISGQKKNKKILKDILAAYPFITIRKQYDEEGEIATFLVFSLPDMKTAETFKARLKDNNVPTGVMNYWHFIANKESVGKPEEFLATKDLLDRTVFIEILLKMDIVSIAAGLKKVCDSF
ncbi:MAG: DegT/DnrJ/EryC1/StrS family aminotransferase [Candidatus Ratteibacteria bacterium]